MVITSKVRWLLDCPFGQVWDCIVRVVCILTNILVVPSFVLRAITTLRGPREKEEGVVKI